MEAEQKFGRPVYRNEVSALYNSTNEAKLHPHVVLLLIQDLWRNDELLADTETITFSARPEMQDSPTNKTGFMLYSDRMHRVYPTYKLDERLRLVPGPDTPTVNFSVLKEILLSKDLSRNAELEWVG